MRLALPQGLGPFSLQGKTALISGANGVLGRALALALAALGAKLILLAPRAEELEKLDDEIRAAGGMPALIVPLDITKSKELASLGAMLATQYSALDILVVNAAIFGHFAPIAHADSKEWDNVLATNLTAPQRLLASVQPLLLQAEAARVVFVSCAAGQEPQAYGGAYAVSKAGFNMLARLYALENNTGALKANLVDPSAFASPIREAGYPGEDSSHLPDVRQIAARLLYLCSPDLPHHGEYFQL
ncbi:MAG: SDR family NAD(P)-dependent oxidoreductase [Alphaproteobacteria bacterium]